MEPELLLSVLDTLQTHMNAGFEAAKIRIRENGIGGVVHQTDTAAQPETAAKWNPAALDVPLPAGDFRELEHRSGITYRWPDDNVDKYTDFVVYEGAGGFAPVRLALGRKSNGERVGFVLGPDDRWMRGITYFQRADDFDTSTELLSYIRGGGKNGKAGFGSSDALPTVYSTFQTQPLRQRITGAWNRLGVVVKESNVTSMLGHTFAQGLLRRII